MKFQIDHDLHIHSMISPCAGNDPRQTKEAILSYGVCSDLRLLCLADHIWDEKSPTKSQWSWLSCGNDMARARSILPLPQSKHCRFLFGMEVDMDMEGNLAATREEMDTLDFLVFAPSHLHMDGFTVPRGLDSSPEVHKNLYLKRMDILLNADIPYGKTGLAHPACSLACKADPVRMFDLITDREYEQMWTRVRDKGMGVEINISERYTPEELERVMRLYRIAKAVGCKFYLGGDAHIPEETRGLIRKFQKHIDILGLTEEDKLPFVIENRAPEQE